MRTIAVLFLLVASISAQSLKDAGFDYLKGGITWLRESTKENVGDIETQLTWDNLRLLRFDKYDKEGGFYRFVYIYVDYKDTHRKLTHYSTLFYKGPSEKSYTNLGVGVGEFSDTTITYADDIISVHNPN